MHDSLRVLMYANSKQLDSSSIEHVISHPGGPNGPIINHPIAPVSPVISHSGEDNVGAESPISPSSQGDPGGSGFAGGPVGIPSF